ncbi:MAG TPA: hypothetical protein VGR28_11960 [Candidatus Thermoplasmatota archaeon]|jgi:hypothetical protein|nr:hypothetical protein [Candidatus Thermoplasmatota archaeon]
MALTDVFSSILVLSFGLFTLLSGVFTAYFGAGKSRKIGLGLTIIGLLALIIFAGLTWGGVAALQNLGVAWSSREVMEGIVAVIAAGVGAFLALGLFLVSIMKA